jgi:glycosyltransferase involved in cell wall biosynthesis
MSVPSRTVCIDASNLRHGGGVQVAASFLDQLALMVSSETRPKHPWLKDVQVVASPEVIRNLLPGTAAPLNLQVRSRRWYSMRSWVAKTRYDVKFVVFGPQYGLKGAKHLVMGFADPNLLYDRPAGIPRATLVAAWRGAVRSAVAKRFIRMGDVLVVETDTVRQRIGEIDLFRGPVVVVPNVVNEVFRRPADWRPIAALPVTNLHQFEAVLCFISRAYPHKNFAFLPQLARQLWNKHQLRVKFVVTLTDQEWQDLEPVIGSVCQNLGPVDVSQAPSVYRASTASIFPSLLECFSVTPLEAMTLGVPVFASDRDFVRSVCGEAPEYFDPCDASSAADVIASALRDSKRLRAMAASGLTTMDDHPSAADRATNYVNLIAAGLRSGEDQGALGR